MPFLPGNKGRICALAYSPDGSILACGGEDRKVHLIAHDTQTIRVTLRGQPACVYPVAFSAASAGGDGKVVIWDLDG
jgi:WD40 repeat protein